MDAVGQTLRITKTLAFDKNFSITINFYDELAEVPENNKTFNIRYLQINNYISETFLKTTKRTKIEIDKVTKINTPDTRGFCKYWIKHG